MDLRGKRVLLCDCEKTMPLNGGKLEKACQAAGAQGGADINTQLCRAQLGNFQAAVIGDKPLLVACSQEAPLFSEVLSEDNPRQEAGFFNIREAAAWSEEADKASAKIAAIIAAASIDIEPTSAVSFASEGTCLVYGRDGNAIEAAKQLSGKLDVTVLLTGEEDVLPPRRMDVPIFKGQITSAKGHLGAFAINVDGYAAAQPSSKAELTFDPPRNNAFSECDLILDLTGGTALFPAHDKRDGYLRPDPDSPGEVQKAIYEIAELVGEFEKPRYVLYDEEICAHGRSTKTGCTRCLDVCPTSAIVPNGDHVKIDPHICGGCGLCSSVCPTGAATYQYPPVATVFERLRTLIGAYRAAGGPGEAGEPVLLVHDERDGEEMISIMARAGRGLPANVLPFPLNEVTQVSIDFLSAALGYGAAQVVLMVGPEKSEDLGAIASQIALAETVMEGLGYGADRVHLINEIDPEKAEVLIWDFAKTRKSALPAGSFLAMGGKRTRTMLALRHLHEQAENPPEVLPLPAGAPFGAVEVDTSGCTLCLACVSACPTGALLDDEEKPWLGFNEEACVQCGLCRSTCPESVIELKPRINFGDEAKEAKTLNEQEPFCCIRCGKPFGVKTSIDHIVEKLGGKHSMFANPEQVERIMMCDDCRVVVQFDRGDNPLAGGERPKIRTTDDYLREREEIEEARAKFKAEQGEESD